PVFTWISYPIVPVLEWLGLPEAATAAPATLVGFADMFLPAVLLTSVESELTRFVIGCLSLTQLIYMSEVGVLILQSKLRLNFVALAGIFVMRSVLTLPIVVVIARTLFFGGRSTRRTRACGPPGAGQVVAAPAIRPTTSAM